MPMFVDIDTDHQEYLFVIGTTQVATEDDDADVGKRKRDRSESAQEQRSKSAKVVEVISVSSRNGSEKAMSAVSSVPPSFQLASSQREGTSRIASGSASRAGSVLPPSAVHPSQNFQLPRRKDANQEPLFLPATQESHPPSSPHLLAHLPPASQALIKEAGLGIEDMTGSELLAMLEQEGEEVGEDFEYGAEADVVGLGDGTEEQREFDLGDAVDAEPAWDEEMDDSQFMPESQVGPATYSRKVWNLHKAISTSGTTDLPYNLYRNSNHCLTSVSIACAV